MAGDRYPSVEHYFDAQSEPAATTLRNIYSVIKIHFPEAEIVLAWNVPQVKIQGKYVFGADAAKKHISIAPWSENVMRDFDQRLDSYSRTKGLFRVPLDWEVDSDLIVDLVHARMAELSLL